MAQVVSCQPVTAEAQVRAGLVHVGFMVDKVALEHISLLSFCCQYHSTFVLHTHISGGE
jgi:hypothetical protein